MKKFREDIGKIPNMAKLEPLRSKIGTYDKLDESFSKLIKKIFGCIQKSFSVKNGMTARKFLFIGDMHIFLF